LVRETKSESRGFPKNKKNYAGRCRQKETKSGSPRARRRGPQNKGFSENIMNIFDLEKKKKNP